MKLIRGNCLIELTKLKENSVDAIVTDPPYGLKFMGKKWDYDVPTKELWSECLRVLKPGGHLLAFGGTRTYHRLVVNIEDAGFEIRDQIQWLYGSGFPKSLNVSKALGKEYGCQLLRNVNVAEKLLKHTLLELREETTGFVLGNVLIPHVGELKNLMATGRVDDSSDLTDTFLLESDESIDLSIDILWSSASVDDSDPKKKFITLTKLSTIIDSKILSLLPKLNTLENICGGGTALKPANEPICLARKPLEKGLTVAQNVLKWGTGALNIDGSRIASGVDHTKNCDRTTKSGIWAKSGEGKNWITTEANSQGRWPANLILDEVASEMLDEQSGTLKSGKLSPHHVIKERENKSKGYEYQRTREKTFGADSGGASHFFM